MTTEDRAAARLWEHPSAQPPDKRSKSHQLSRCDTTPADPCTVLFSGLRCPSWSRLRSLRKIGTFRRIDFVAFIPSPISSAHNVCLRLLVPLTLYGFC